MLMFTDNGFQMFVLGKKFPWTFYTLYDLKLCEHSKYKFVLIFTDNRFQMFLLGQKVSVDLK